MNISDESSSETACIISTLYWIIQVVIMPPLIVLYVLILYIIARYKDQFKNSYFTLILNLGISDLIINLYLYHGFFCCLYSRNYLGMAFDSVLCFLMTCIGWFNGLYLNIFISMNRFTAIAFFSQYKQIWSLGRTKVLGFLCFVAGVLSTIPYYVVKSEIYVVDFKSPGPPGGVSRSEGLMLFDMISGYGGVLFITGLHVISALLCVIRYKSFSHVKQRYIREIKLLVQGTFVGLMLLLCELLYYAPVAGDLTFVITSFLSTSLNPLIYLIMDNRLRNRLLVILQIKKENLVYPLTHTIQSSNGTATATTTSKSLWTKTCC